ncbi:hypothetical protein [Nostocoides sp. HKS02]|uniref:hypothetical protein n=1 Tax=Nostocoides sp. HKS02 TaxID=1813880 RepID=UPI0012B4485C|nr:hypothetical protein [Tetrasphaera sp. HKS02]QGN58520.1 hypothetical protein GKE56_12185 [Tetrasphaera sp. HKS02]
MTAATLTRALGAVRRAGAGTAYASGGRTASGGKDFSAIPVCGAVRPLAQQRARAQAAGEISPDPRTTSSGVTTT